MKSYDGTNFAKSTNSNYGHVRSRFGSYLQRPFVVGGRLGQSHNSKTENMNIETGNYEWEIVPDFPESGYVQVHIIVLCLNLVCINIFKLCTCFHFKCCLLALSLNVGTLQQNKYNIAAIHIGNNFLIMGGARVSHFMFVRSLTVC